MGIRGGGRAFKDIRILLSGWEEKTLSYSPRAASSDQRAKPRTSREEVGERSRENRVLGGRGGKTSDKI